METVGFIGLGNMGGGMSSNIQKAGYQLVVYDVREESTRRLLEGGARLGNSPADVASRSDITFTSLPGPKEVEAVALGKEGVLEGIKPGTIYVDLSSSRPTLIREMEPKFTEKGAFILDAPVSGGEAGAVNGELTVMAGGDKAILESCDSLIKTYSKSITLMGEAGAGQLAKMVNQICIAGVLQGLSEGLLFAEAENLDMDKLLSAISGGAAQSWQMVNRGKTMHNREFDFGFAIKWMVKDLGYCIEQAKGNQTNLTFTQEVYDRYINLMDKGHTYSDTSALMVFEELNN